MIGLPRSSSFLMKSSRRVLPPVLRRPMWWLALAQHNPRLPGLSLRPESTCPQLPPFSGMRRRSDFGYRCGLSKSKD
jgi:hypothetical protein